MALILAQALRFPHAGFPSMRGRIRSRSEKPVLFFRRARGWLNRCLAIWLLQAKGPWTNVQRVEPTHHSGVAPLKISICCRAKQAPSRTSEERGIGGSRAYGACTRALPGPAPHSCRRDVRVEA